jgi:hypothetical protein
MNHGGDSAFTVRSDHRGNWTVLHSVDAIRSGVVLEDFEKYTRTQQQKLRILAEGVDLTKHTPATARFLKLELDVQIKTFKNCLQMAQQTAERIEEIAGELTMSEPLPELGTSLTETN